MTNPYLQDFQALQEQNTFKGEQWFGRRRDLVDEYSWAVPNESVLTYLSEFDHLYEAGAGSGYWAAMVEASGGDVTAFDKEPPDETWMKVEQATVTEMAEAMADSPVLVVWPPYGNSMASSILDARPSHVLYVGEARGGCTATDEFFGALDERYGLVARIDVPSYKGINDQFFHYIRKL